MIVIVPGAGEPKTSSEPAQPVLMTGAVTQLPDLVSRLALPPNDPHAPVVEAVIREAFALGYAKASAERAAEPAARARVPRVKKQDIVADLLRRPEGCMAWEILEATGWPTVNIPRFAAAAGLVVRKVRAEGNRHRFFGVPVDQAARASAA